MYPSSPQIFQSLVELCHLYTVPNKIRLIFDEHCHKKPSIVAWLFALSFEMSRSGSRHSIHALFERALANDMLQSSVILLCCYIAYQIDVVGDMGAAKRIFFRAIHSCPWSKKLWLDGFLKLNSILSAKKFGRSSRGDALKIELNFKCKMSTWTKYRFDKPGVTNI